MKRTACSPHEGRNAELDRFRDVRPAYLAQPTRGTLRALHAEKVGVQHLRRIITVLCRQLSRTHARNLLEWNLAVVRDDNRGVAVERFDDGLQRSQFVSGQLGLLVQNNDIRKLNLTQRQIRVRARGARGSTS